MDPIFSDVIAGIVTMMLMACLLLVTVIRS